MARERSFIMVKPDAVQRGLVGEIISRFQKRGFVLVASKVTQPGKAHFEEHYGEHKGKPFFPKLVDFASSGPVVAMVWEGDNIIATSRTMIGATDSSKADPGTIRGDRGVIMGRNAVHGSDSTESAEREIALWFKPEEVYTYKQHSEEWVYENVEAPAPAQPVEEKKAEPEQTTPAAVETPKDETVKDDVEEGTSAVRKAAYASIAVAALGAIGTGVYYFLKKN